MLLDNIFTTPRRPLLFCPFYVRMQYKQPVVVGRLLTLMNAQDSYGRYMAGQKSINSTEMDQIQELQTLTG